MVRQCVGFSNDGYPEIMMDCDWVFRSNVWSRQEIDGEGRVLETSTGVIDDAGVVGRSGKGWFSRGQ